MLIVTVGFLILNLLAPRGFVQWVLIQQDIRRVKSELRVTKDRINVLESEIKVFQTSDLIKEQKLRELGYLKPGELSLEFVDTSRKNTARAQPSKENRAESSDDVEKVAR